MEESINSNLKRLEQGEENPEVLEKGIEAIQQSAPLVQKDLRTYSSLSLAFIGDCVFELIMRTRVISHGNRKNHQLHQDTVKLVNAHGQMLLMNEMKPFLTDEEKAVFRRGRNAKPASTAKNQSHHDYRIATGLECLMGYLYLAGRVERILELIGLGEEALQKKADREED